MGAFDQAAARGPRRMQILLMRRPTTDHVTLGELFVDGDFECYTLERPETGTGPLAIAPGVYKVILTPSLRFKRILPLVIGVRGRHGIRIHPGNTPDDTEGCILLGTTQAAMSVGRSREACDRFQSKLESCLSVPGADAFITVRDAPADQKVA